MVEIAIICNSGEKLSQRKSPIKCLFLILYINWDFEGENIHTGIFKIPTNYNAPQLQYDIVPGNPDESILLYRMTQTEAPDVMPQIGRSINHNEGIEIIREYIYNIE